MSGNSLQMKRSLVRRSILFALGLILALLPATSLGASGGISMAINQIDDSAFPVVTAYVTVGDATGAPIGNIAETAFAAAEDTRPISDLTVTPVVNANRGIALVLAIDVSGSMQGAPLDATRVAARALIENLGPQDQVAIVGFNQDVTWLQDFTTDHASALQALDSLKADGDTALNDALHEAARQMASSPAGRRAIVLLTDGEDTASRTSEAQALTMAQASGTPIYTVGFGGRAEPDLLRQIGQLTGGQYFEAPAPEMLMGSFEDILRQLKQQYVLTYRSELAPDMREHELLVRVEYAQDVLEDTQRFLARAITPTVTLLSPADGALVRGSTVLDPAIVSANPISQVVVLLDNQPLASFVAPPYVLDWDTTAVPAGNHRLAIEALDSTGRLGRWEVQVAVAPPLAIRFRSPSEGDRIGGQVTLAVDQEAAYELDQVTYRLDDLDLGVVTAPPHQLAWQTGAIALGPHRLTAQARDVKGNVAEASIMVDIVPPVAVTVLSPAAAQLVSGMVPVQVDVQAASGLAGVELWVNGQRLAQQETSPYEFTWDSNAVRPGEHTLLVRAVDLLGQSGESQVTVRVALPQKALPSPWVWALVIGGALLALLVALLARRRARNSRPAPHTAGGAGEKPVRPGVSWLVWQSARGGEQRFALVEGENTIGRDSEGNRIAIAAPTVSRKHAVITLQGGDTIFRSLSERSTSSINGDLVLGSRRLKPGDRIELGDETLVFIIMQEEFNER
jgi:VWFA-related protein